MSLIIKLPHCKIRFLAFIIYNAFYVLYMLGYTSQSLYLGTLILFCMMNGFFVLRKKEYLCKREFKLGTCYVLVFLVVSVLIQLFHMDFQTYLISGLIRIFLPIINAFLFVNSINESDYDAFFNVMLLRFVLHFLLENYQYLNPTYILAISWKDSSSVMESSMAHDFIIMEMYYLFKNKKMKAIICMVFCMLSMKRISFILAPLLLIMAKWIKNDIPVNKKYLSALKGISIISPFLIIAMYSDSFQIWLYNTLHVDLNVIMSGRPHIYKTLVENIPYFNGYGSVNNFLTQRALLFNTTWDAVLHNDFLRIYFETTIFGVIVLANNLVELTKKQYWHFIMISYLLVVAITSHILNYFSVWITFYLVVMCSNSTQQKGI